MIVRANVNKQIERVDEYTFSHLLVADWAGVARRACSELGTWDICEAVSEMLQFISIKPEAVALRAVIQLCFVDGDEQEGFVTLTTALV